MGFINTHFKRPNKYISTYYRIKSVFYEKLSGFLELLHIDNKRFVSKDIANTMESTRWDPAFQDTWDKIISNDPSIYKAAEEYEKKWRLEHSPQTPSVSQDHIAN